MAIKLSGLSAQNAWWKGGDWTRNDNDLKTVDIVLQRKKIDIKKGEVHLLRGVRRAGKTVYIKLLIKDMTEKIDGRKILYLSCDRHAMTELRHIVKEFVQRFNGDAIILDEITYLDGWNIVLKELAETTEVTMVATGSNPIRIKEKSERLPGRKIEGNEYFVNPLNFREFVSNVIDLKEKIKNPDVRRCVRTMKKFKSFSPLNPAVDDLVPYFDDLEKLFYGYLLTGGFPDAVREYFTKGRVHEHIYETIIRLFLGALSKEKKSEEIGRALLEKLIHAGTSRLDFLTIASDIGVHHNTVREYIDLLESSRVLYLLPAWDISKKKYAFRKQKKIIFQSSLIPQAIHQYLTGCVYDDVLDFVDKNLEGIVEHLVSSHVIWHFEKPVLQERHTFAGFYYNTNECDLVVARDRMFYGHECKYGKPRKEKYPFPVIYVTKDAVDEQMYPAPLFLVGLEKSDHSL